MRGARRARSRRKGDGVAKFVIGAPSHAGLTGRIAVGNACASTNTFVPVLQGSVYLDDTAEGGDKAGRALAVGDFDRDGRDDLVIGVPLEDFYDLTPELIFNAGTVHVIPGTSSTGLGLSTASSQWDLESLGVGSFDHDQFGRALGVGDFDCDGIDDLAIGAPYATWTDKTTTGLLQILYGSRPNWLFGDGFERGDPWKWSDVAP